MTEKGQPIEGLGAENFRGRFRDKPVRLISARSVSLDPRIVILLDVSGSMRGRRATKWQLAAVIAGHLAMSVRNEGSLALAVFGGQFRSAVEFGKPPEAILDAIRSLQRGERLKEVEGPTALMAAVQKSAQLFLEARPGDLVYVITDGEENVSRVQATEVENALRQRGLRLFATLLVPAPLPLWGDELTTELSSRSSVEQLAAATGGHTLRIETMDRPDLNHPYPETFDLSKKALSDLTPRLHRFYSNMTVAYELELEFPYPVDKPSTWSLQLFPRDAPGMRDLQILYPRTLLPCLK